MRDQGFPHVHTDPATGRKYGVEADGTTAWLDERLQGATAVGPKPRGKKRAMAATGAAGFVLGGLLFSSTPPPAPAPLAAGISAPTATATVQTTTTATATTRVTVTRTAAPRRTTRPATTATRPRPTATRRAPIVPTTDRRYATCAAVRAAGLGPYQRGVDPEYAWYNDRDNDGKVCER